MNLDTCVALLQFQLEKILLLNHKSHFKNEYVQLVPSVSNAENVQSSMQFPPVGHLAVTLSNIFWWVRQATLIYISLIIPLRLYFALIVCE